MRVRYTSRVRAVGVFVCLSLLGSCTESNPAASCKAGSCSDPAFPYCDGEGAISGTPGTCIAVTCMPGEVATCLGDDALTCATGGAGYERIPCDLGCRDEPTPHCGYIEPRYVADACDALAVSDKLTITESGELDANLDATCNGGIVEQAGAPSICVARYRSIHIEEGATLKLIDTPTITAGRVIAFVTDDDLTVDGVLDISADSTVSGPGGGALQSGGYTRVNGVENGRAGGGAGGKTAGGSGGNQLEDGGAMNGGAAAADPAVLAALLGGAAAFQNDDSDNRAIIGGGGGGAALLASCRGAVRIHGVIDAGGGGGMGGILFLFGASLPGGGGGAGGYVVLQAKTVEVTGKMFANGGSGGNGMQSNNAPGNTGQDGPRSSTQPARSGLPQNGEGRGGDGGIINVPPTAGTKPTVSPAAAGGGGGSIGFFQTYTPDGFEPTLTPMDASPAFQPNGVSRVR